MTDLHDRIDELLKNFSDEVGYSCVAHSEGQSCCVDKGDDNYPKLAHSLTKFVEETVIDEIEQIELKSLSSDYVWRYLRQRLTELKGKP